MLGKDCRIIAEMAPPQALGIYPAMSVGQCDERHGVSGGNDVVKGVRDDLDAYAGQLPKTQQLAQLCAHHGPVAHHFPEASFVQQYHIQRAAQLQEAPLSAEPSLRQSCDFCFCVGFDLLEQSPGVSLGLHEPGHHMGLVLTEV